MPKIVYESWKPQAAARRLVNHILDILDEYVAQGFDMTIRQVYYQVVARDLFPDDRMWTWDDVRKRWFKDQGGTKNADPNYQWLKNVISRARLAGMVDWETIVDRTRHPHLLPIFTDEPDMLSWTATPWSDGSERFFMYRTDRWARQKHRFEVWVEKEALAGVFRRVCDELHVPLLACRGYLSSSASWRSARRFEEHMDADQYVTVLHFGDHDPSGCHMTKDNLDRLTLFDHSPDIYEGEDGNVEVERMALNMDQVRRFNPPPNPAKLTDPRSKEYVRTHGEVSWELDALQPSFLAELVRDRVIDGRDEDLWQEATEEDEEGRRKLSLVGDKWAAIQAAIEEGVI